MKQATIKTICVYCGSHMGNSQYQKAAIELGNSLAANNIDLVYGGASVGLMGEIANTVLAAGGKVSGVIPHSLIEKELAHPNLSQLHIVDDMHARKQLMHSLADAFIAMPGGYGTIEETFEIMTWLQLGLTQKPCGILNVNNFFEHLILFIEHMVASGFVAKEHQNMLNIDTDPAQLIDQLERSKPPALKTWTFAANSAAVN